MAENKTTKKKVAKKTTEKAVTAKTEAPKADTTAKKVEVKEKATTSKKETKAKVEEKKVAVKKYIAKVKKENKKKSTEAVETQKTLKEKKKLPTFRGRFGKKNIRRKSKAKWQKWRKPRSIDLDRGLQHGYRPKIGYRSKTELRDIHPSGYVEVMVRNINELETVEVKTQAIRISATVGKRKRNDIITQANKKGIWVLN